MIRGRIDRVLVFTVAAFVLLFASANSDATLYVIVLDKRGISIASDSRRIILEGKTIKILDALEKVIPLGTNLAFMSSGLTEISSVTAEIRPTQIVRRCYADLFKGPHRFSINNLSDSYAKLTTERLNGLTDSEKDAIESLMRKFAPQGNRLMESIIAGTDSDGTLKVETIDFYLSRPFPSRSDILRFEWNLNEAVANEASRVILSGEVGMLRRAFEDAATPIRQLPQFQRWAQAMQEGRQINTAQTAAALLNLAIKYSPPDQPKLGYPIFLYTLSVRGGMKKVRIVPRGEGVDLPH